MKEIHGHEVMHMMVHSGKRYTRESLRAEIVEKFGAEARFYTCSASGMDADGIIDFLAARGKFSGEAEAFTTDPEKICKH